MKNSQVFSNVSVALAVVLGDAASPDRLGPESKDMRFALSSPVN